MIMLAAGSLPAFGSFAGRYGELLNATATAQRHVTDVVAAVNFDYRGIDTLGEEYVLFAAVAGVMLISREMRGAGPPRLPSAERPSGLGMTALWWSPVVVIQGVEVVTHGQVDPGGGFQGGVMVASGFLMLYLAGALARSRRLVAPERMELVDSIGAAGFALVGLAGWVGGALFLSNVLPLGPVGQIDSGGSIAVLNMVVGVEVTGGFAVVFAELAEQLLVKEEESR